MRPRVIFAGGFLGAGKTTTLVALAQRFVAAGQRVGIITNDQAENLVDTGIFRAAGLQAVEVAGGCFCCRFDDFTARADELLQRVRPDVLLAEPVGSCTDIVATVLNPLRTLFPNRFEVAPYVVLVDPIRALKVLGRTERVSLSERVTYIYRMQQQEADAIALTKIDLLSASERQTIEGLVRQQFPGRPILGISAVTGEGMDELAACMGSAETRGAALEDLDYDVYAAGEAELGWLNETLRLTCDEPLPLDGSLLALGRLLQEGCERAHVEIAHGKAMLAADDRRTIVNLVGEGTAPRLSRSCEHASRELELTLNLRVQTSPETLTQIAGASVLHWAEQLRLTISSRSQKSFSPGRPVPTHRIS
ncbi:MAG: GTP-binding protein [Vicinamibacterales bacterium]